MSWEGHCGKADPKTISYAQVACSMPPGHKLSEDSGNISFYSALTVLACPHSPSFTPPPPPSGPASPAALSSVAELLL